ncbi:hypothetical protein LP7551_04619 [Roseibium album]|nr:hypothetical protein LP7551_04619 [Roseibium album]
MKLVKYQLLGVYNVKKCFFRLTGDESHLRIVRIELNRSFAALMRRSEKLKTANSLKIAANPKKYLLRICACACELKRPCNLVDANFVNVDERTVNWDLRDTAYKLSRVILLDAAACLCWRAESNLG